MVSKSMILEATPYCVADRMIPGLEPSRRRSFSIVKYRVDERTFSAHLPAINV